MPSSSFCKVMLTSNLIRQRGAAVCIFLFGGAAMQCACSAPAAPPLICPASMPISASPVNGWKVYVGSELYLNSATPISGPPEMRGDLAEYTTRPGKREWSYVYDLDRDFPDGKWLECGYGIHNEVTLSQRMPDSIKRCVFTYRKGAKAGQNDIKIDCR